MKPKEIFNKVDQYKAKKQISTLFELECNEEAVLTEEILKKMHRMLGGDGEYRQDMPQANTDHVQLPEASEVPRLVGHFMSQLQISRQMFHPIEYAAICHKRILELCPFNDKNEEVAFLVLNLLLKQAGYESIIIKKEERETYREILRKAQHPSQPDIDSFIAFIGQCVLRSCEENQ